MIDRSDAILLGFPEYIEPTRRLGAAAELRVDIVRVHHFPDGESGVTLPVPLPSCVVLCRSLNHPNEKLVELVLAGAAARDHGARHLILVAPYLCYMRQDMAFHPGEAVSQQVVGKMLADVFDEVITVDPHLHRVRKLGDAVPASRTQVVTAASELGRYVSTRMQNPVVLGPDAESEQWVKQVGAPYDLECVVGTKVRRGDRSVILTLPDFDFNGREVVIVDDVASTGETLIAAVVELSKRHPSKIAVCVTHALFVDNAADRLRAAGATYIWSADTIPHDTNVVELAAPISDCFPRS